MPAPAINLDQALYVLSGGLDLVGVDDVHHGKRTAYIALRMAERLPLDERGRRDLYHAAVIHDLGVSSTRVHRALVNELEWEQAQDHCDRGAERIARFRPLAHLAGVLRHHHTRWSALPSAVLARDAFLSNLVFLADRVDTFRATRALAGDPDPDRAAREAIARRSGDFFAPELASRFLAVSEERDFFAALAPEPLEAWFAARLPAAAARTIGVGEARQLGRLFAHVVDAKSPYTARHSEGVASLACHLARRLGLPEEQVALIEVAALLHDLGKLRVPDHILEKPGPLDAAEWRVMRRHVQDSYDLLRRIDGFRDVAGWAALHHVRPGGSGYPDAFRSGDLPLPARIIAVADVFQALAQDRPYRPALAPPEILSLLEAESRGNHLDAAVVALVADDLAACWRAAVGAAARG